MKNDIFKIEIPRFIDEAKQQGLHMWHNSRRST